MCAISPANDSQQELLYRGVTRLIGWVCTATLIFACCEMAKARNRSEAAAADTLPILVELFTSEGCSSCPPADAMLEKMDAQPIPGAQLIVLSEHVDYWDHDGWKDPYSSSLVTERQNDYVRALGLKTAYTPQVIVDGMSEIRLSDPQQCKQVFQKALAAGTLPVRIVALNVATGNPAIIRGRVEVDKDPDRRDADVYVVAALDHAESQILRGENSGKHLTHVAVVEQIKRIARVTKGNGAAQDFDLKLKSGNDPTNLRLVAFVQQAGPGKVLGAALRKSEN
jgi:hypothetical protein